MKTTREDIALCLKPLILITKPGHASMDLYFIAISDDLTVCLIVVLFSSLVYSCANNEL